MPWSPKTALAALVLVFLTALAGFGLLAIGDGLGWLFLLLATWFTVGMVATATATGAGEEP